jgi:hypothetical protein
MRLRSPVQWACLCLITFAALTASAEEAGKYREFSLGATAQSVLLLTRAQASDLKTLHQRPAALQELAWRPRYSAGRTLPDVDPVGEIVFSFYEDQLYRIAVHYDRARTAGLTHDDLVRALVGEYGEPLTATPHLKGRNSNAPADAVTPIARWERGDTQVSLFWSDYRAGFGLLVTSEALEGLARGASVAATALDAREAPAREAARQKKAAEDLKAAEELVRQTNKGAFRP